MRTSSIPYAFNKSALVIAAGVVLAGWPAARAQSVPIANASFEIPQIPAGTVNSNGIPGWFVSFLPPGSATGVANLPAESFFPTSDGTQVGFIKGFTSVDQTTAANLTANTRYILRADFFVKNGPHTTPFARLSLIVGLLIIAHTEIDFSTGNPHTLVFDALPGINVAGSFPIEQLFGLPIKIEIQKGAGDDVFFDNVRLEEITLQSLSQGFGAWDLAQRETMRQGVNCLGPVPCSTTLEVIDRHGVLLKQAHLFLPPGTIQTMDFPSEAQGREPMEVIPRWFLTQGSADFSLELFDSEDLRTRFFVNWGDGSVAKTGNLDSGPATLTRGDSGRLKVYCDGSVRVEGTLRFASCQASLAFHDANGRVLKQSKLTLAPGTAGFLDLSFDEIHSADRRAVVIPSLNVTGGPAVGSFALLDTATGITITQSYPGAVQSVGR